MLGPRAGGGGGDVRGVGQATGGVCSVVRADIFSCVCEAKNDECEKR